MVKCLSFKFLWCRANFLGTNFTVFDDGVSPKAEQDAAAAASTNTNPRQELAAVLYVTDT